MALLDWRNTPTVGIGLSPVQRLMSKRTKTLLPTAAELLKPKVYTGIPKKLTEKRQKTKAIFDQKAHELPPLITGQPVYVRNTKPNAEIPWKSAQVEKVLTDRSYIVREEDTPTSYRRNRVDLKPKIEENTPERPTDEEPVQLRRSKRNRTAHTPYEHIP